MQYMYAEKGKLYILIGSLEIQQGSVNIIHGNNFFLTNCKPFYKDTWIFCVRVNSKKTANRKE